MGKEWKDSSLILQIFTSRHGRIPGQVYYRQSMGAGIHKCRKKQPCSDATGINTHINPDLAKAAVQTCPGEGIYSLKYDFEKINDIIEALAQQIKTALKSFGGH